MRSWRKASSALVLGVAALLVSSCGSGGGGSLSGSAKVLYDKLVSNGDCSWSSGSELAGSLLDPVLGEVLQGRYGMNISTMDANDVAAAADAYVEWCKSQS